MHLIIDATIASSPAFKSRVTKAFENQKPWLNNVPAITPLLKDQDSHPEARVAAQNLPKDECLSLDSLASTYVPMEMAFRASRHTLTETRKHASPFLSEAIISLKVDSAHWNVGSVCVGE